MSRDEIISALRAALPTIQATYHVRRLALFGSAARGDQTAESDVDILADFGRAPTFDEYMDAKYFLEDLLHARVDLVTPAGLRSELRRIIESEAVRVA